MNSFSTEELRALLDRVTPGDWLTPRGEWSTVFALQGDEVTLVATLSYEREHDPDELVYADAQLLAESKRLAAEVIRLRGEVEAVRLAGKHLAVKLADCYRVAGARPTDCQALRDWLALMPARAALEMGVGDANSN